MTQKQSPSQKKKIPIFLIFIAGLVGVVLLTAGGFGFAATQETHDSFCASCHTQPESTFFQRSTGTQPVDLASFHTPKNTRCIDCHSGVGVSGRIQAELMGASNAFKWYSGTAVQPAVLIVPIAEENCTKCHAQVTQKGFTPQEQITVPGRNNGEGEREGRGNHWHQFLARWQTASATAGTCVSCHSGHSTGSTAQNGFMNAQNVQATCEACHQVLRKEGEGGG